MAADGTLTPGGRSHDREDDPSDQLLTLAEAVRRYNFSPDVLRRRLATGGVPGARPVATDAGQDWLIPVSALAALGYRALDEPAAPRREPVQRPPAEPAEEAPTAELEAEWTALEAERRHVRNEGAELEQAQREARRQLAEQEAIRQELDTARRAVNAASATGGRRHADRRPGMGAAHRPPGGAADRRRSPPHRRALPGLP
jgi:hypothetical protein